MNSEWGWLRRSAFELAALLAVLGGFFQSVYFKGLGFAPLALLALACAVALPWVAPDRPQKLSRTDWFGFWGLLTSIGLSALWAAHQSAGSIKTTAGFLAGAALLFAWKKRLDPQSPAVGEYCDSAVSIALATHLTVWVMQYVTYHVLDGYPEFLSFFTGEHDRIYYAGQGLAVLSKKAILLRPTGLANEPSTFALFAAVAVLLMSERRGRFYWRQGLIGASGAAIAITSSVTGWTTLFVVAVGLSLQGSKKTLPLLIGVALGLGSAFLYEENRINNLETIRRIVEYSQDSSARARLQLGSLPQPAGPRVSSEWLGRGLGNNDPVFLAGSGWGYLCKYFGPAFAIFFITSIFWMTGFNAPILALWALFLINAPYFQHPIFWVALAVLSVRTQSASRNLSSVLRAWIKSMARIFLPSAFERG